MADCTCRRNHSVLHNNEELLPHEYPYLPDTLRIMGHIWRLGGMNPLINRVCEDFTDGICDSTRQEIALLPGLTPSQVGETLLHEVLEALNAMMDLNLEHQVIQLLGLGLFQVLNDNGFLRLGQEILDCDCS